MERTVPLAAKKLQSGDIRLVVQNKDFLLRNWESIQAKVQATLLRQSFPLEVCGVPLSLGVKSGKRQTIVLYSVPYLQQTESLFQEYSSPELVGCRTGIDRIPQKLGAP